MTFVLGVVAITLLSGHVSPSVDDNNRYLKVTPQADGIRFAYTVFFGEIPGASERKLLDANHDGQIDTAESKAYGDKLASQVASAVDIDVDGRPQKLVWSVVDVGMGSREVAAGSFSVDMIAYLCGSGGTTHRVKVRDQFRVPRPGETDVKVEDSPSITVTKARIGPADDATHEYRFVGPGGPLSDDGLDIEFKVVGEAPRVPDDRCGKAIAARKAEGAKYIWLGVAMLLAGGALGAALLVYVRKRNASAAANRRAQ
ncbi:MAG TPA: hypothetical protein VMZ53_22880 [Kofleriaceae bacterium]|nr:hypothetical protein [Kofleriaceae bacterium]